MIEFDRWFRTLAFLFLLSAWASPCRAFDRRVVVLIGDGHSHLLRAEHADWTVAQWQQILPAAKSLDDELDWAILQSSIDLGRQDIILPRGTFVINRPIQACGARLHFAGEGQNVSRIVQVGSHQDGIRKCWGKQQAVPDDVDLLLERLSVVCGANAGCGEAVYIAGGASKAANMVRSIAILSETGAWTVGIHTVAASHTIIQDDVLNGGSSAVRLPSSTGILLESHIYPAENPLSNASFGTFIARTELFGWDVCVRSKTSSVNGVEGVYIDHTGCDASRTGIVQSNDVYHVPDNLYQAPVYDISHCQFHVAGSIGSFDAASQVLFSSNVFIIDPGSESSDIFLFRHSSGVILTSNFFSLYPGAKFRTLVSFVSSVGGVFAGNIVDNGYGTSSVVVAGLFVSVDSVQITESNNVFLNWAATHRPRIVGLLN